MEASSAGSVNIGLDLPIVSQHRLEDNLMTEKSVTDLQADEPGPRELDETTHDFISTRFLLGVGLHLVRGSEGAIEEWNFPMIGECRCDVGFSFINGEAFHVSLNVFQGSLCNSVPEGHDPRICLETYERDPTMDWE